MQTISNYFWSFVQELPALIAMLAGLVFAFTRWKRFPKVSLIVALSLGLLILHTIVFLFIYQIVPPMILKRALELGSTAEFQNTQRIMYLVIGLIFNTLMAVGFGLLLAGIFIQRKRLSSPDSLSEAG